MKASQEDKVLYIIVVNGIGPEATRAFCDRFPNFRGGVRPDTMIPYSSVPCEIGEIENSLAWVTGALEGNYTTICIVVSVSSPRSWSNYSVPQQILQFTQKYKTELKVSFSSAAQQQDVVPGSSGA